MGVTAISRDSGVNINIVRMTTSDNLAAVIVSGYLTAQASNIATVNSGTWTWLSNDMVLVNASDGEKFFNITSDLTSLTLYSTAGDGAVTLPVVSGNFTVFDGTLGALKDAGFTPSNASDTKVVMSPGSLTSGNVPFLNDVNGTLNTGLPPSASGQAYVVVSPGSLISGNVLKTSDTHGTLADTGVAATTLTQLATVNLTAAQFNGMYATPVQLIAAPGAGKYILIESIALDMTFVSAQYAAGGAVGAQYGNTAHLGGVAASATEAATDYTGAAASTIFRIGGGLSTGAASASAVNTAVYISNATAAFTTGDSTFKVNVYYRVVTF